jgi:hypothetical protein
LTQFVGKRLHAMLSSNLQVLAVDVYVR